MSHSLDILGIHPHFAVKTGLISLRNAELLLLKPENTEKEGKDKEKRKNSLK